MFEHGRPRARAACRGAALSVRHIPGSVDEGGELAICDLVCLNFECANMHGQCRLLFGINWGVAFAELPGGDGLKRAVGMSAQIAAIAFGV